MRAAFITGHGGNEVVAFGDRPMPPFDQGSVLVRMKAASLNRVDLYMRDSGAGITHNLPQIMGVDGAGVVEAVDDPASGLSPGQPVILYPASVCGRCEWCLAGETMLCVQVRYLGEHRDGTMADFVRVPAGNLFAMPDGLDFGKGAALGVAYLTAWRMLFTRAAVRPGETVLIFGIGGGVSLAALQLAQMVGVRVFVTSRDDAKLARAVEMGADRGLRSDEDVVAHVVELTGGRGVDVVIENVGEAVWPIALRSVARGGRIITCGATTGDRPSADLRRLFVRQIIVMGSTLGTHAEFARLLSCCGQGRIAPLIGRRFPLEEIHAALDTIEAGSQFGKCVVDIDQDSNG
ncbi:MAG TPA: NADPH:quinone reductase [Sphingobium sp.]|mgnify:FL=1|nr:NADPH:quinone reductase [Erythrobacter sp.]HCW61139.1 NADPH:quinone reductase [Sphingobium sp.]|tara:strand:- start:11629 stop:12672 length:1044 start_codon:yes stop_codon:yes gene_type:complete